MASILVGLPWAQCWQTLVKQNPSFQTPVKRNLEPLATSLVYGTGKVRQTCQMGML